MAEKIPITKERKYSFEGLFDIKHTYNSLKSFVEDSRHYDLTEREYEETSKDNEKKLLWKFEAEQEYNDYYKIIIKIEVSMQGKNTDVEVNGKMKMLSKGKAEMKLNSYIFPDFQHKKHEGSFAEFLDKLYEKFFGGKEELHECIGSAVGDINELIARFKQNMNSTI